MDRVEGLTVASRGLTLTLTTSLQGDRQPAAIKHNQTMTKKQKGG